MNDEFQSTYEKEYEKVKNFIDKYHEDHPGTPLKVDDADNQILMMTMTFLNTQTKLTTIRQFDQLNNRIFSQYLSYLLEPLPTKSIVEFEVGHLIEKKIFYKEDRITLQFIGFDKEGWFHPLVDNHIYPVKIESFEVNEESFMINIRPIDQVNFIIPSLHFYVYSENYSISSGVIRQLEKSLKKIELVINGNKVIPCEKIKFRPCFNQAEPLKNIRNFFHFPWESLYFILELDMLQEKWDRLQIQFHLESVWVEQFSSILKIPEKTPCEKRKDIKLYLGSALKLFTMPIVNLINGTSKPIDISGKKMRHPIQPPVDLEEGQLSLHSVKKVYQYPDNEMSIDSEIFDDDGYGIEYDDEKQPWLLFHDPYAFIQNEPKKLKVKAVWFQSWLRRKLNDEIRVRIQSSSENLQPRLINKTTIPHKQNHYLENTHNMLEIINLCSRIFNDTDNLLTRVKKLLAALGANDSIFFKDFSDMITSISAPYASENEDCQICEIEVREVKQEDWPLIYDFLQQICHLLHSLSTVGAIKIHARIDGIKEVYKCDHTIHYI